MLQIGSLDKVCSMRLEARKSVREGLSPDSMRDALKRFLPCPCTQRYTAIVLLPQGSLLSRLWPTHLSSSTVAAYCLGLAAAGTLALAWSRRR